MRRRPYRAPRCGRASQPGWVRIGVTCSAGRRSMWARITPESGEPTSLELCAGREGDDAYLLVRRGDPAFDGLLAVVETAIFAAET